MKKVLLVGSFWHGSIEESYARAFEEIGVEVIRFDFEKAYYRGFLSGMRITERVFRPVIGSRTSRGLVHYAGSVKPDLTLVFKGPFITPDAIKGLSRLGAPLVNFNPDSPWERANTSRWLLQSIPYYDLHFTWSHRLQEKFKSSGARKVAYLPFAYDPKLHSPLSNQPKPVDSYEFDVVFLGSFDPIRDELLRSLSDFKIAIWGNGWHRARKVSRGWVKGKAVYGEEGTKLLDRGLIALNILRPQNMGSHNMRTFEIPATRHLMLTTRSQEQSQLFAEGAEIECYGSVDELRSKVRMLIDDPARVLQMAEAGYQRVRDETYAKRAREILNVVGL